jgi:hypothetical protein
MKKIFFNLLIVIGLSSCQKEDAAKVDPFAGIDFGGQVTKIETLGQYSKTDAALYLQLANLPYKVETTTGFSLYRITYTTKNWDNRAILVSGLLGLPDTKDIKGIVSYHHGTNVDRNEAPSKPTPQEGIGISSIFAGDGYILLAPDYIGLGVSKEIPTYLNTPVTVNTVIDFLKIGSKILSKLTDGKNTNLYATGFSQGGCVTAGLQRELQIKNQTGLTLKASAAIDGAYNLKDIAIKFAVKSKTVLYLGYVANSYANMYKQNLNTIISDKYLSAVPTLFDGSKTSDEVIAGLPIEPADLYKPKMLAEINSGQSNWFTDALEKNEAYKYKPITPLRLYYGTGGIDVATEDAIETYKYMKKLGGNVELVNTGDNDHTETLLHSLPEVQKWFNQIK